MSEERFTATYLIETAHDPERAAEVMAGEQSAGTFVRVPGETDELRERHGARVERVTPLEEVDAPSLPGSRPPRKGAGPPRYRRAEVTLSFPAINVGASLPQLMTTVAGNLFELGPFSGLRLLDLTVPEGFKAAYPGPQFGVEGTRALAGVHGRPLVGTIIKPSVGLSPRQTAELVRTLAEAGLDFVKDDELIADPPYSPLAERVKAVMAVIDEHAARTGKRLMYAFNISDELDAMLRHHDTVLEHGGTCVMVNMLSVGLAAVSRLRRHSRLPIHGHRNGWGALTRHPALGMDYRAFQKLWRVAGVDHLHVNGLQNKFCEPDESVVASARECLTPLLGGYTVMPVFSSGQWAGQIPDTYRAMGSTDLIYLAGGGIMGHPGGPAAGVASLLEAWEAALAGVSLEEHSRTRPALRQALEQFGTL
jgi:ribulose-bisphosphate carboxylase large chain